MPAGFLILPAHETFMRRPIPELVASNSSTTDSNSYSFGSQSFGPPCGSRLLIAVIITAIGTVDTVTLGAVSATVHGNASGTNSNVAIASAIVPTGDSGTVAYTTTGGTTARSGFALYRVTDVSSTTPSSTHFPAGGANASRAATVTIPAIGFAVAGAVNLDSSAIGWTNATEDTEFTVEGAASVFSFSSNHGITALGSTAMTADNARAVAAAAWA